VRRPAGVSRRVGRCAGVDQLGRAKLKQSVRKLPTRPKNVAQNSVFDDFSGSERSEAAKARPDFRVRDRLAEFSHGLQELRTKLFAHSHAGHPLTIAQNMFASLNRLIA
jgi:hypothetical protein